MKPVTLVRSAMLSLALAAPSFADATPLVEAIRANDVAAVDAALASGHDPDAPPRPFTPLGMAVLRGDVRIVNRLLEAGADPDAPSLRGMNALSLAVRGCHAELDVIEALIDAGADIENRSGDGITPLMLAIQEKRADVALRLLEVGADVNTLGPFGDGVLNYAIYVKDPVLVRAALDRGVDTAQLRTLFTTVEYDPPGIDDAKSHHEVLCDPPG